MKTILLVAGQSTRFWPLTEKPLFPIAAKPLVQHVVERLEAAGCDDVIFVGSANNLQSIATLYPDAHLVEQTNLELGMRGALLDALPHCMSDDILIVGSNDIIDSDAYHATIEAGRQTARSGAILAQTVDHYFPGGYLSIKDNRIAGIVEKPGEGNEPSNLVNIVCHYHNDASVLLKELGAIDDKKDDGYGYEKALDSLFQKHSYAPVPYEGVWQAIKYPWHVLDALPLLLQGIAEQSIDPSATIHETAVIDGPVIIEEGVKVLPHACIKGPAFIGRHSVVGNGALVRGSSIGEHCVIGFNTEVKSSALCDHVWTHSTYIGDSVIGENVSFGAGSVTGNLRLDEGEISSLIKGETINSGRTKFGAIIGNNVRMGIHSGVGPGIKIGRNSFIGSHCLIEKDVENNSFVRMKNGEISVRENRSTTPHPNDRNMYRSALS